MADPLPPPPPPRARWALLRGGWRWLLLGLMALPVLAGLAVVALLASAAGSAWLLGRVPGLALEGLQGALIGPATGAARVRWRSGDGRTVVEIDEPRLAGIGWRLWPHAGSLAGLQVEHAQAAAVRVRVQPDDRPPLPLKQLRWPFSLHIAQASIGRIEFGTAASLEAVQGRLTLGAAGGGAHQVEDLQARLGALMITGRARIGSDAPLPLEARIELQAPERSEGPLTLPAWAATVDARGPLDAISFQAALSSRPGADGRPAGQLKADATWHPFRAWPLGRLQLAVDELDLAPLLRAAPRTSLSGQALIESSGMQSPMQARIELRNAAPGLWSERRLPLRHLKLDLAARPDQRGRIEAQAFEIQLGDARASAGRISGQAVWAGSTAEATLDLGQLRPAQLDARAPAMTLEGPLMLRLAGLPSPDPAGTAAAPFDPRRLTAEFSGKLQGRLDAPAGAPAGQAVQVALQGQADARRLRVIQAEVGAGSAIARFDLDLERRRDAGDRWHLRTRGSLSGFDPARWWPGDPDSAWRRGPHRIDGRWVADVSLPPAPARTSGSAGSDWLAWLPALQGEGQLDIDDSLIAGVPLAAQWKLSQHSATAARRSRLQGRATLGGNRIEVDAQGDPLGAGDSDRARIDIDATALATLAPLVALAADVDPALRPWAPRAGRAEARIELLGRWPNLRSRGELKGQGLAAGPLTMTQGRAQWQIAAGDGEASRRAPLELTVDLSDTRLAEARLAILSARISGSLADHQLGVQLAAPVKPPLALERAFGLTTADGTRATLNGRGQWWADAGGGFGWRGQVERLFAGAWDRRATPAPGVAPAADNEGYWIDARGMRGELRFAGDGRLAGITTDAGSALLAGGIPLQWDEIRWAPVAGGGDAWALRAKAGPVAVAPFLRRAQPDLRWGGDLRLSARIAIDAAARFGAELALERESGDLFLTEGTTALPLALTQASLRANVRDGLWQLTPLIVGARLGTITGSVQARAAPAARWPAASAPIDGALHAAVPQLAAFSGWLPPGWRLDGEGFATARIDGRVGAPNYTGELQADRVALRNLLLGVDLREGRLRMDLQGETARITEARVRGGDGELKATGSASFGAEPSARLQAEAERFRLLGRVDRRLVASGRTSLALSGDQLRVDGKLTIDNGLFDLGARDAPSLDDDVDVRRRSEGTPRDDAPAPAPRSGRRITVAIDLDLGRDLRLRGRGLETGLRGQLKLSTPGGRLVVEGNVNADNGSYAAYGQKLEIERGVVAFRGPPESPALDILALRPNLDVRVGVAITGTPQNPRVRLVSEPEMAEAEKLSWLVLGRGSDGLGRTDTALLQRAAVALLAGEGEAPTDTLLRAIGIDDLSVRQTDGETRDTIITLGKQLSRRWYVGYERSVNATVGTWQLIYRAARRFTLRAQSGVENSLDLIWTWRFD